MAFTAQETDALVAELAQLMATERGQKAFRLAYDEVREANPVLMKFEAFVALEDDIATATDTAVREIIRRELHVLLVSKLRQMMPGTPIGATVLLAAPNTPMVIGRHQAMFRQGGLIEGRWIQTLSRTMPCVGAVIDAAGTRIGTAFLVGPNLVLTAAHVVWRGVDTALAPPGARADSRFTFEFSESGVWDQTAKLRTPKAVGAWLATSSPPCGDPPDFPLDDAKAAANLDFALVRIDERLGDEFSYFDVTAPPAPTPNEMVAVCGYPSGRAASVGFDLLERHAEEIGRLHYRVDTIEGMSGAPCITVDGKVLGIHEGAVEDAQRKPLYNRSVYIGRITPQLLGYLQEATALGPDAASSDGSLRWLTDAASEEALRVMHALTLSVATGWRRHPVFGRENFQQWVAEAARTDAPTRVALVGGADGAGKSFSAHLLRSILRPEDDALCVVTPEVARTASAADIFRRMGDALHAPSTNGTRAMAVVRPESGALRHDVIPDGLDWLQRSLTGSTSHETDRRLWLVVDFGRGDDAWVASSTFWAELLTQAVRRAWIRLVIIGSMPSRFADFRTLLQVPNAPFEDDVQPVDEEVVMRFVELEMRDRMEAQALATTRDQFRATLRLLTGTRLTEQRTATAAWCVIATKDRLAQR